MMNCNFRTNSTLDQNVEEKQVFFQVFYPRHTVTLYFKKKSQFFFSSLKKHLWTVLKVVRNVAAGYILRGQNIENIHMK